MDNINGALGFRATLDDEMSAKIRGIESNIRGMSSTAVQESSRMSGAFKGLAIGIASAFTFDAALNLRQKLIEVRGQFQAFEAVLKNSLGSQQAASEAMQMLSDTASKTPFQLDELTGAYVKLVNQGFKPTKEEITKLGDLASATGKGFDQLAEAVLDAQTGQYERLKEFGIKANAEGDKVIFTFKGIKTEVQNTSESIQQYLVGLGDMQGVKGSMAAISATLVGQVSNLEDSITAMFNKIGQESEGFLSGSIDAVKFLVDNYEKIGKILMQLVATYGAYKTAVIATTAVQAAAAAATKGWTIASQVQYTWLLLVEKAQKLLNATMLTNPYVLAATAIMSAVAALVLFNRNTEQVSERQEKLKSITEDYNKKLAEEKGKLLELTETAKNEAKSKDQRIKALNELKSLSGGYLNSLSLENIATAQGAKLLKDYNEQLEKKIVAEGFAAQKTALYQEKAGYLINIQNAQNQLDKLKGDFATDNTLNIKIALQGKDIAEAALKAVDSQIAEIDKTSEQILSKYKSSPTATPTGTPAVIKAPELDFSQWDEVINKQVSLVDAQVAAMAESEVDTLTDKAQKYIDEFNKLQDLIQRAVDNSNSLDDNIRNINADYDAQISALGKSGLLPEEIKRRTDALNQARQEDIEAEKDAAFQKSDIYKQLNDEYVEYSKKAVKMRIELIREALKDETKLSKNQITELKNELKQLEDAFDFGIDARNISEGLKIAIDAVRQIVGEFDNLNEKTKEAIDSFTQLGESAADFAAAAASGNVSQAAGSAVSYLITMYSRLFKISKDFYQLIANGETDDQKTERLKQEFEDLKNAIESTNIKLEQYFNLLGKSFSFKDAEAYQKIFGEIRSGLNLAINELERLSGLNLDNYAPGYLTNTEIIQRWISANEAAIQQVYDKINSGMYSGQALEELQAELEQYQKLSDEFQSAYMQYQELITGSTYSSILDSIIQGFRDGKTSIDDFSDTFEDAMRNALLQGLKTSILEGSVKGWMEQFTAAMETGGLDQTELDALQAYFESIITNAGSAWELIQQKFPDLFGEITSGTSELTGAIKGITEETASLIAGQFNAVKMYVADLLGVARENLAIQGKIENNTFRLHSIERILLSMRAKSQSINPNNSAL